MILNFALWSLLISLVAASFLYPLRLHYRGQSICQIYSGLIILPALVSSLYLFFMARGGSVLTSRNIDISFTSISLSPRVSTIESYFLVSIGISVLMIIFFGQKTKLAESLLYICSAFSFLTLVIILPNPIVRTCLFCIGGLIANLILINRTPEFHASLIVRDVILQRIADFLAVFAFFITLNQTIFTTTTSHVPAVFFNISVIIRIASTTLFQPINNTNINSYYNEDIFRKIIISLGSIVIIISDKNFSQLDNNFVVLFSSIGIGMLVITVGQFFFTTSRLITKSLGLNALIITTLLAHYWQWHELTSILFSLSIIGGPLTIQEGMHSNIPEISVRTAQARQRLFLLSNIGNFIGLIVSQSCLIFARTFTNIISPIYSGFCFYYLPRILIGLLQIPLRMFYNGNIQRSLMFAALLIGTYIFWWVKQ